MPEYFKRIKIEKINKEKKIKTKINTNNNKIKREPPLPRPTDPPGPGRPTWPIRPHPTPLNPRSTPNPSPIPSSSHFPPIWIRDPPIARPARPQRAPLRRPLPPRPASVLPRDATSPVPPGPERLVLAAPSRPSSSPSGIAPVFPEPRHDLDAAGPRHRRSCLAERPCRPPLRLLLAGPPPLCRRHPRPPPQRLHRASPTLFSATPVRPRPPSPILPSLLHVTVPAPRSPPLDPARAHALPCAPARATRAIQP